MSDDKNKGKRQGIISDDGVDKEKHQVVDDEANRESSSSAAAAVATLSSTTSSMSSSSSGVLKKNKEKTDVGDAEEDEDEVDEGEDSLNGSGKKYEKQVETIFDWENVDEPDEMKRLKKKLHLIQQELSIYKRQERKEQEKKRDGGICSASLILFLEDPIFECVANMLVLMRMLMLLLRILSRDESDRTFRELLQAEAWSSSARSLV